MTHNIDDLCRPTCGNETLKVEFRDLEVMTDAVVGSAADPTVGHAFLGLARRLVGLKPAKTRPLQVCVLGSKSVEWFV